MLSSQTRLRLEDIAARIKGGLNVSFEEMQWAQKWADHNKSAEAILRKARRIAIQGEGKEGSLDQLMQAMDIGDPDPSNHKSRFNTVDDILDFFKRDDSSSDWRQHD